MPLDRHDVLLRNAKQDELVLERLLDDCDVDDDPLGFHAQQGAEKLLKAALVSRQADYPRTHNLGYLFIGYLPQHARPISFSLYLREV
jgi:HEPN domain-containing protein